MFYKTIPGLLLILFIMKNSQGSVEKISYRGWSDCYKISNDSVEIIVNASAMGNILVFKKNGVNFMWEDNTINGKTLGENFEPDAGRFDYGPEYEVMHIHNITWEGPYSAEIIDEYTIKLTSRKDTKMGIQTTRLFKLDSIMPYLKITQTMTNISDMKTSYYFLGRTLVPAGGKIFAPLNPQSSLAEKWVRYIWGNPNTFSADLEDPGVEINDSIFSIIPNEAGNSKYGTDSESGWMAYGYQGMIFLKTYQHYQQETYIVENGLTDLFYVKPGVFAELEPVSPVAVLDPGQSYSFVENWRLIDYAPASDIKFDVLEATEFVFNYLIDERTNPVSIHDMSHFEDISIFPNPVTECFINLSFLTNINEDANICIFDKSGTKMKSCLFTSLNPGKHTKKIHFDELAPGMYFVRISFRNQGKVHMRKLCIP